MLATVLAGLAALGVFLVIQVGNPTSAQAATTSGDDSGYSCSRGGSMGGATPTCEDQFVWNAEQLNVNTPDGNDPTVLLAAGQMICFDGWNVGMTTHGMYRSLLKLGWDKNSANYVIYLAGELLCKNESKQ